MYRITNHDKSNGAVHLLGDPNMIHEVVQQALSTGYLSLADEERLRALMVKPYGLEDIHAFWRLQRATMEGAVKQESREMRQACLMG
ncbi:hypothetical protein [Roseofilum reptotaenium]|nr:hypothetical protein [Roseofilum reptotaenium]